MPFRRIRIGVLFFALSTAPALAQNSADVARGKQLFEGMCARCHGYDGVGGEGPNLNKPNLARAADDESLRVLIRDGIPSRGMPRPRRLSANELQQLVGYVRSIGRTTRTAVSGNPDQGKAIYERSGCTSCHIIKGAGGSLGPELSEIGSRRAPDYLRKALLNPGATLPRGTQAVPGRGFDEFLLVRVTTRDGHELRGMRINEDSFTIQLRDGNNQFHSFQKSDLVRIDKEAGSSLMPSYRDRLSVAEVDDLIAYLLSLGGAK
jgi:putative heme-binding domain-containing protein